MNDQQQNSTFSSEGMLQGFLSAVLHQTGVFLVFFAVPVQLLAVKRGIRQFVNAVMISLGVIAIWKGFQIMRISVPYGDSVLIMLDLLLPASLFAGLGFLNFVRTGEGKEWHRLLIATCISMAGILPLLLYARQSPVLAAIADLQHEMFTEQGIINGLTRQELLDQLVTILFRGIGGVIAAMLAINFYFGSSIAGRKNLLQRLILPRYTLAIAGGAGGLLLTGTGGLLAVLLWNLVAILGVMYFLIGVSLIGILITRMLPRNQRRYLILGVLLLILFVPLANVVVLSGLPVAGLVETVFRIRERYWNKE